jgi:hypothetical protein
MAIRWSSEEENLLKFLVSEKRSPIEIAQQMKKTKSSILNKSLKMNLSFLSKLESGQKFGNLIVLQKIENKTKSNGSCYLCKCDCGNEVVVSMSCLKTGNQISCGCSRKENRTKPKGVSGSNSLYARCRSNAKSRELEFNISKEFHVKIISSKCNYCGSDPIAYNPYLFKNGNRLSGLEHLNQEAIDRAWIYVNTIDRLNNNIGYTENNCVPCCWPCNAMKRDRTEADFLKHISKIQNFQNEQNEKGR